LVVAAALLPPEPASADYVFNEPNYVSGVMEMHYLDVSDLDSDGLPDIVASTGPNDAEGLFCVFLNEGGGTFSCTQYGHTGYIRGLATGEFDGNGIPDLAISSDGGVCILLGMGDGSFGPETMQGSYAEPMAVCDLNGDDLDDLLCRQGGYILVHLCDGDGTFTFLGGYDIVYCSDGPFTIEDMNLDGNLDVLYPRYGGQYGGYAFGILYGNGNGTLQYPQGFIYQDGVREFDPTVAVGDFNEDGFPDVSVTTGNVITAAPQTIALSDGSGGFSTSDSLESMYHTWQAVADFDMDGHLDLAFVHYYSIYYCAIAPGAGDGTFSVAPEDLLCNLFGENMIAAEDFDLDGDPDLAVAERNYDGYGLCVYLNSTIQEGLEGDVPSGEPPTLDPSCNPFTSSVTIACEGPSLPGQLMIYDITGRLIRSLSDREGSSFLWDGRDRSGARVPTGTYLIQGAIDGQATSIKVVRL